MSNIDDGTDWEKIARASSIKAHNRKIRVALSPACNMYCTFCDHAQGRSAHKPGSMEDLRKTTIEKGGLINAETYIKLIKATYDIGFRGVTFTGGEPTMNLDWDKIVQASASMGMKQICLTTNGLYLDKYLRQNERLPDGLTLLTVSYDGSDEVEFSKVTGVDGLHIINKGLKRVREIHPNLTTRANRVVTRSSLPTLLKYIEQMEKLDLFDEVNLLNLILKSPGDSNEKKYFEREFIYPQQIIQYLESNGYCFSDGEKFEPETTTKNGKIRIIVKDTNKTLRNASTCDLCPVGCQEGFYTIWIATDGTMTPCLHYRMEDVPNINGVDALTNNTLDNELQKLALILYEAELRHTLGWFIEKHGINLVNNQ